MENGETELPNALEQQLDLSQKHDSAGPRGPQSDGKSQPIKSSAELPPSRQKNADEVLAEMKKIPLFMTSLDDIDEDNEQLQALRALADEGTRAEQAANWRQQGNQTVRARLWRDAREFYMSALQVLKQPRKPQDVPSGPDSERVTEIDEEAERREERAIEEACYANRALCNLEMKNYGSCQRDCAAALRLNEKNIKAWYRAASACLALDKIPEALDACQNGLTHDPSNTALKALLSRVEQRRDRLAELKRIQKEREERLAKEQATLQLALSNRGIRTQRKVAEAPKVEDSVVALADPLDEKSTLTVPVILLYPVHAQSDFIKAFGEDESLGHHLDYILPLPWDKANEYTKQNVECYMETMSGGLIKAGKNLSLSKLLGGGKVAIVDDLVSVNVVPKAHSAQYIADFKQRHGKA